MWENCPWEDPLAQPPGKGPGMGFQTCWLAALDFLGPDKVRYTNPWGHPHTTWPGVEHFCSIHCYVLCTDVLEPSTPAAPLLVQHKSHQELSPLESSWVRLDLGQPRWQEKEVTLMTPSPVPSLVETTNWRDSPSFPPTGWRCTSSEPGRKPGGVLAPYLQSGGGTAGLLPTPEVRGGLKHQSRGGG